MLINLNGANTKTTIKSLITQNLPGRQGRRDLRKALRPNRIQALATQMGDRPDVPNVCVILTNAFENDFAVANLSQYYEDVCDHVILLRHAGIKDWFEISATVCPSGEEKLVIH